MSLGIRQGQRVQVHQRRLSENIGTISGIVGLAGGLGGFVLPIMFGALMDITGVRSSAFMLMYGVAQVSLIWMYWTEVRRTEVMGPRSSSAGVKVANFEETIVSTANQTITATPAAAGRGDVADWRPEDEKFWDATGKKIAYAICGYRFLHCSAVFAVWGMWGIITVQMLNLGFLHPG